MSVYVPKRKAFASLHDNSISRISQNYKTINLKYYVELHIRASIQKTFTGNINVKTLRHMFIARSFGATYLIDILKCKVSIFYCAAYDAVFLPTKKLLLSLGISGLHDASDFYSLLCLHYFELTTMSVVFVAISKK